ncbi:O-antigen ligase family protein [Microbaculum marinum]|uniref:O-antigen ligase family protein n=1 Tax=Microbaculum marinum TaxID=1764581 RepID=A0AAW9RZL9_9HYPH
MTDAPARISPADDRRREHWTRLDRRLVRPVLWLTIALSFLVIVEPSPYEFMFLVLCWAVLVRGITIPRFIAPVVFLLPVMFTIGGITAVLQVVYEFDSVRYVAISMYLTITTVVFAALVAEDPVGRLRIIRSAYIVAAVIAALAAIVGYFGLVPGAKEMFTLYNRASGTFKDPNVYGPFLVFPALLLIQDLLTRQGGRILTLAIPLGIIAVGVLLSFSRAAWAIFMVSTLLMGAMMFAFTASPRLRLRMGIGAIAGAMALGGLIVGLLAVPEVSVVFQERADLSQSYDVGTTGRFAIQKRSIWDLIDQPLGMGPLQYSKVYGQDPHNVFINSFASYGWIGGFSFITFVVLTWIVGIRYALVRTPWQNFHFAALATFLPLSLEGFIVDIDHWRHFYLMAGLLWGMSAAAAAYRPQPPARQDRAYLRAAM